MKEGRNKHLFMRLQRPVGIRSSDSTQVCLTQVDGCVRHVRQK